MRFQTLSQWLSWQETLHCKEIDLRLERVREVLSRLGWARTPWPVITVAGTNGKGSCVAMLEAILGVAGYRVGTYTSPHLLRYNERIRMLGEAASDAAICAAFERIDRVRDEVSLTYFEFGTLAALDLFARAALDIVVLEVGLGGRLDAVNAVDTDVALIATVDIDHTNWLGSDRESIGREKAGILRAGRPAVCGDPRPPASLLKYANELGVSLLCQGRDFGYQREAHGWDWWYRGLRWAGLPTPNLPGVHQFQNAAAVLAVLQQLGQRFPVERTAAGRGLRELALPMRCQVVAGAVPVILDVAHNPEAARALAGQLAALGATGRVHAVLAMLADKDVEGVVAAMRARVDTWYTGDIRAPRALSGAALGRRIEVASPRAGVYVYARLSGAMRAARAHARPGDCVVAFGSFYALAELHADGALP